MSRRFGSTEGDDLSVTPRIQVQLDAVAGSSLDRDNALDARLNLQDDAMEVLLGVINRLDTQMAAVQDRLDRIDPPGPPE